ncbi:MAG: soxR [Conexibacter sp.]|nr:soxR [Conexibacter sp.]
MEERLTIAEIARRSGVAVSHVRYYQRAGLLPPGERAGRELRYPAVVLERLRVIAEAQQAGLSLSEIRELSELPGLVLEPRRPSRLPMGARRVTAAGVRRRSSVAS